MSRYRVSGPHAVLDHEPGKTFEADLDPVHEQRLLAGGHLRKLEDKKQTTAGEPANKKE